MKADKILQLIAYLESTLDPSEQANLEEEIKADPQLREELERLEVLYTTMEAEPEAEVPDSLRSNFYHTLQEEKVRQKNKQIWISWGTKIAAGIALLVVGIWLGLSLQNNNMSDQQMAKLKNEIDTNRQLILKAIDKPSASQRFIAVNASENIQTSDQEIMDALVKVMNTDDNTNVRLAAVRALARFAEEEKIRKELISALLTQSDPLVQVALIEILVDLGEKQVVPTLERLIKTDTTLDAVKEEAHWGVMKLS